MMSKTVIIHHLFTGLALITMALRLLCRQIVFHKFNFGDYCTMVGMLCAAARGGIIHVVLVWGTNNMSSQARAQIDFTPEEIYRRTIGSKLTIANRPIYNSYLWLQKLVLLHFFARNFHPQDRSSRYILWSYGFVFLSTWIAAQVVGFTECDPFNLYWQVSPAPGKCVQAQVQLVVLGVLNIVTDSMLLVLPLPTLISLQTPWRTKIRLYILCALAMFIIAITIIRLPINAMNAAVQANRTIWASTELLTAAIVVNAPTLYGAINHWRQRWQIKANASRARRDDFSNTRTAENSARLRFTHPNAIYDDVDDDDNELMLRAPDKTSARQESTTQQYLSQEGIVMKPLEVSYCELGKLDATRSNGKALCEII
ncbi:hypothetical protein P153DRAFT_314846 [Dothidotthia symphoricarpi CBS 119687]|uniref:Rhodopsin domain-containing protein n=1 Tax=Dothidotthia symphoricarpi CBS 119687 TaxID=1392245 RepID=A0A6A6AD64_9PLEO|nr:uncharacterized protein P153DRAFT_314846 [Dothidotthia symphoricarpi CBS 119687]KAF2129710.1 hypothetical protein P153DRAFT_314846 [Dothidotthia symphoricarpi CBS 119687]